jgi:hypothetical protein
MRQVKEWWRSDMGDLITVTCDKCGKQVRIVPGDEEICAQCEEGA